VVVSREIDADVLTEFAAPMMASTG
jgi:hypothetical protein